MRRVSVPGDRICWARLAVVTVALGALGACSVVSTVQIPTERGGQQPFVATGDIAEPYMSLGVIQATRRGVRIFGFLDPAGTSLEKGLYTTLLPEVRKMGGDGIINVRFEQTQYTVLGRVFSLIFLGLLPTEVTYTGEVVKLARQGG